MLRPEPIADELWTVDTRLRVAPGFVMPVRMVVARLPGDGLWLHSPVPIDDALAEALDRLGPVRHAVGPNLFHHMHLGPVAERWPDVALHGAPGLARKRGDLTFASTLGEGAPPWDEAVLQPIFWAGDRAIRETVFLHRPTGTLIAADAFMNVHAGDGEGWLLGPLMRFEGTWNRPGVPRLFRLLRNDRAAMAEAAAAVRDARPTRIVPGHGRVVDEGVEGVLDRSLAPFLRAA